MSQPAVADIVTYLRDTGWRLQPTSWRNATIWSHDRGEEVLVPPGDDLRDTDLRVREILSALAAVEGRPGSDIAEDIRSPLVDTQSYRTFPEGFPSGFTSLPGGLRALQGVRDLLDAAARAVVEGPRRSFTGNAPASVGDLLRRVELGPTRGGSFTYKVRIPVGGDPAALPGGNGTVPLGRQVAWRLHQAVAAIRTAAAEAGPDYLDAFDHRVDIGVSANLCEALSRLAGRERRQPFDVAFHWGRGMSSPVPASTVSFPAGMGIVVHAAGAHLRRSSPSGPVSMTGTIEGLHDDPAGGDRWRVQVRGELVDERGARTARRVWVRLAGQAPYDRAMQAHRMRKRVSFYGDLSTTTGRTELVADAGGFDTIDPAG